MALSSGRNAPGSRITSTGRSMPRYNTEEYNNYLREVTERMRADYERMRVTDNRIGRPTGPQPIEVELMEFYAKENAKEHHTSNYELVESDYPVPVLRRGQPFYIAVRFKRSFNFRQDSMRLEFTFGPRPLPTKGTLVPLKVTENNAFTKGNGKWDVRLHHSEGNLFSLHVHIPASVGVGVWKLRIVTELGAEKLTYECRENIYVLFNPWCKEDAVYMDREDWRQEYVLNDVGKIFVGSYQQPKGRRWIYGQFADAVLPASIFMLELSRLDYSARSNPVRVVRAISGTVNKEDDNGVVEGNWSGSYEDGTAPWMWTGSAAILEQFLKGGGVPVKYGQCWVFAGVCTTVCRALGIPCRTVSNFVSAHDTDDSLTVDKFFDKEGEEIEDANNDSIWNFHVWSDCWMSRQDLPAGYGGWQAIDATPQETSEGVFQTGPASLEAIRLGQVGFLYDAPFVFSEVNADVVHWQFDETSKYGWRKLRTNKYHVGRSILTRSVGAHDDDGDKDAEDILHLYKNPEGTDEERMAVLNAARNGGLTYVYDIPPPEKEDVFLDMLEIEKIMIGQPFLVTVNVENRSEEVRTVGAVLSASSVFYTGILARKIKREQAEFVLKPGQSEVLSIQVTADDYLDKLVDYAMIKIYALATIKETQQTWAEEDDFVVEKPKLIVEAPSQIKVGQTFTFVIHLTNPLKRPLRNCLFSVEGPGIMNAVKMPYRDIPPGDSISHEMSFTPQRVGPRTIAIVFSSVELIDIVGSAQVEVVA